MIGSEKRDGWEVEFHVHRGYRANAIIILPIIPMIIHVIIFRFNRTDPLQ